MKLTGKKILIFGASGVIGRAILMKYAHEGADIIFSGGSKEKVLELEKVLLNESIKIKGIPVDVTSKNEIHNFFAEIGNIFDRVDIVIIAFGIYGGIGALSDIDIDEWKKAFEVNLFGTVSVLQETIPLLKKSKKGKIIIFAGGGEGPKLNLSSYVSSKAATVRMVETLAGELKPFGIDINSVAPGAINSQFTKKLIEAGPEKVGIDTYEEATKQMNGEIETVDPSRVAALAMFLADSDSDGITGKIISVPHDPWADFGKYKSEIIGSDVYTFRRIKPKDRGYEW